MPTLCVNIDHIATIRNARGGTEPDPLHAASICEMAGAVGITFHLREDRRHIRDEDAFALRRVVKGLLNMEMAATDEMIKLALKIHPDQVTLVPEKRQELTTEGGLDVAGNLAALAKATHKLKKAGIAVSHFIDADRDQVKAAADTGASHIEIHTGIYAEHFDRERDAAMREVARISAMTAYAREIGLVVNAGHGLNYRNTLPIARIPHMNELNTGHAIIARAALMGLEPAVRDMVAILNHADVLNAAHHTH